MGMNIGGLMKTGTGVSTLGDIGGGVAQLGGQYMGMVNEKDQYKYQAAALRNEAVLTHRAARDTKRAGGREMQRASIEYGQIEGAQRAQLAANGVVVDQDTAAQLGTDVARAAAMDKSTILANAEREAMALRYRADIKTHQSKMAKAAGKQATMTGITNMMSTVMGTGTSVAAKWLQLKADGATESETAAESSAASERAHQAIIGY